MDTEADLQFRPRTGKAASAPLLPEVEAYLQLLVVIFLMNSKRYKEVPGTRESDARVPSSARCSWERSPLVRKMEMIPATNHPWPLPAVGMPLTHSQRRPLSFSLGTKGELGQWSLCTPGCGSAPV